MAAARAADLTTSSTTSRKRSARPAAMPRWTAEEDEAIWVAVLAYGNKWAVLEKMPSLQSRTGEGIRNRFGQLARWREEAARKVREEGEAMAATETMPDVLALPCGQGAEAAGLAWAADGVRCELERFEDEDEEEEEDIQFAQSTGRGWLCDLRTGIDLAYSRRLCGGRGWTQAVKVGATRPPATKRVLQFLKLWKLEQASSSMRIFAINIRQAVGKAKKQLVKLGLQPSAVYTTPISLAQRDAWGLVIGPDEVLPTFVRTHDNRFWLGGPAMGLGGFMLATEAMALMGVSLREAAPRRAALLMKESELWEATADSIYERFADTLVLQALRLVGWSRERRTPLRYGSLCSGPWDAVLLAFRRQGIPIHVVAFAESDDLRRQCFKEAYYVEECSTFRLMEEFAEVFSEKLDVLVVTQSCRPTSTAHCMTAEVLQERRKAAAVTTAGVVEVVKKAVANTAPAVLIMEQPTRHRSHFRESYRILCEGLLSMPYGFAHGAASPSDFGGRHARDRLGFVGVADGQVAGGAGAGGSLGGC